MPKPDPQTTKPRANYLTTTQNFNLEAVGAVASRALWDLGYGVYHVGSSITLPNWRDVDLRCIMADDKFDAMFGKYWSPLHMFLNTVISEWMAARTGLPIDFQFQRQTDCNAEFDGPRSAVGLRHE